MFKFGNKNGGFPVRILKTFQKFFTFQLKLDKNVFYHIFNSVPKVTRQELSYVNWSPSSTGYLNLIRVLRRKSAQTCDPIVQIALCHSADHSCAPSSSQSRAYLSIHYQQRTPRSKFILTNLYVADDLTNISLMEIFPLQYIQRNLFKTLCSIDAIACLN